MNNPKVFLYARKSTESDERQSQSLEDQIRIMTKKAKALNLDIIDVFQESMSAKAPGRRKFTEMIDRVNKGEAECIIAWKLDRLSRNPIDSGTVQYMLQKGILQSIFTDDKEYTPKDAGLIMSVIAGMDNQYILDLSINVKRGMDSKTEKGDFCGQAPEGYLNEKEEKNIIVDKENFPLIRKAWDLALTGTYSVPQIRKILNDKWGYKSNKKNKKIRIFQEVECMLFLKIHFIHEIFYGSEKLNIETIKLG